ncbi:MAG: D-alanyl-D-alanine carboxypeptidase/D-alanyl-D-alanine-endopeptidase [Candidatus Scalindua rubra]|uniref:Putative D-alanyl-D-alaninecarboxypeptidase/D-alanyl-D-alanine-endopeptidase n=1 Tax=Candidatus Scalindua brodae TaxID=237368 RepID=A0A0B0ELK8_9BACT|nr:MAG: putative D-alanyl-D-alaninecarboxypeptidase/D-alanyl-D-alanine- endopeptidase [Candidatus Scalindua brodae]MBZ0108005.1 D-alanyl-D-alanine carboxypeptidase/D-alanyl-D-alanine-endopeptidase [Candidatus Scalindua rubra]TWU28766.1 D-alanyl-D-alanine carboxypeptidase precursor [Candidatus Brocadiaceae bacterium S225]
MKLLLSTKHTAYKIPCFLLVVFLFFHIICLENIWSTPENEKLKAGIDAILQKYKPKGTHVGISVFSVSRNKSLYKSNSDKQFVVASNMKLFTTATALVYLGAGFEYKTEILYRGDISADGKLDGDIIIKGSGDPNISGRFFDGNVTAVPAYWADKIKEHGIQVINGDIIADDSIFDREFVHSNWPKDQLSKWYCAPVGGLSFNDNCVDIMVRPGRNPVGLTSVEIEPETSYVKIINRCKTTTLKSKHSYSLYRKPFTNQINIRGNFWSKAGPTKEYITIHNPPLYMATVFKEILEGKNIRVMGAARVIDETDFNARHGLNRLVITTSSLRQSITVANKRSQGFYAEQILKTLGAIINNEGSFSGGLDVMKDFLAKLGIPEDQYQLDDGSGLSKKNKLTPDTITTLLNYMYNHKNAGIFLKSLPISGTDGTLKKRLKDEPYKSRVMAKTGYVYGARTLSGYVKTLDDEIIAFSILVNKIKGGTWQAKRLQDVICRFLVTYN